MADIRATQSGAFEATSTWVGGVVPGSGDVAFANTFTVTISDTRTVQAISNASGTSITVGGTFSLLNGANLTCTNANGVVQGATLTGCITTASLGVGSSASVSANALASGSGTAAYVAFSTAGILNWTGSVIAAAAGSNSSAILVSGAGTLAFTGNATGGAGSTCVGITLSGAGTITIAGNITGGSSATAYGVNITGTGNVTITGTVTGGTGASAAAGANNASTGTLTVNGTCQSGSTAPAIAAGGAGQITRLSGPFLLGASGNIDPIQAQSWRWAPTQIPTYYEVVASNGSTKRNLFTSDNIPTANYPATGSVRSGVVYGPNGENTGTLAVPAAASVALGVAVDAGVGTAVLTAAAVQTALTSQGLTTTRAGYLDNLATEPPNAATVASSVWSAATRTLTSGGGGGSAPTAAEVATAVRTELTTELGRIDAATSTRLAAASYSAAPTTAAIRTELSAELARLDVAVSTRLAPSGTLATVTTLTNAPSVPSAATIASQVRTELTTELGRIDAAISTRLAPAGTLARVTLVDTTTDLTNGGGGGGSAPSAATVATAVRTELTPELARIANCSTVDTTAAAIQDAVGA
jgi:hypothetical protein